MSRHHRHSGFLVSQLLEILGAPLAEERVWGLCYEMCKSLVDKCNEDTATADEDVSRQLRSCARVVFELDTVYLRKEGSVAFVLDGSLSDCTSSQYMTSFGKLLSTFLGRNAAVSECFKKPSVAAEDLDNLMHHIQGRLMDTQEHWVHLVSDCCVRHALSTSGSSELPSEYYRRLCKDLANEALEVNTFLEVLKNEFSQLRAHDAMYALEWFKARSTVRRWLRVMSELRESFTPGHIDGVSPSLQPTKPPLSVVPTKSICTLYRGPSETHSGPNAKLATQFPTKSGTEQSDGPNTVTVGKPRFSSTPSATCKPQRKVLRPPQRLVDQVTSWMLEAEDWVPDNLSGNRASSVEKRVNLYRAEWSELDSQGFERDVSWSSGRQQSTSGSSPSEDWFREITRIRGVLTELELDTFMEESLFDALQNGKICFCCRHTKFSFFSRWGVVCDVCQKKVCSSCVVQSKPRDLGMSSRDAAAKGRQGEEVLKQIRRVFKPKTAGGYENDDVKICKDCRDFVQRFC